MNAPRASVYQALIDPEAIEFETTDSTLRGEMTITLSLTDVDGGTEILAIHDGLPSGLSAHDNELGWQEA